MNSVKQPPYLSQILVPIHEEVHYERGCDI
jgi:hypothetical protein